MQIHLEATDLSSLTVDLASGFRSAIEKAGLHFTVECPPLPEPVYVDREMWEKVVLNLLSNAFKFTFEGGIAVRLDVHEGHARLVVEDTGTGIPEHELPRLFERFHRVEGTRGRTQEGTGIGLALVAELVKLNGGTVEVRSAPGHGSAFTVSLPFGSAHLAHEPLGAVRTPESTGVRADSYIEEAAHWLPAAPALPSGFAHRSHEGVAGVRRPQTTGVCADSSIQEAARRLPAAPQPGGRVLVADDNADMREYTARLLSPRYHVETVADGQQALARALADPPDLVLSDVMMPGLDGFALLHALRTHPDTHAVPVILLSARAGEEARIEGWDAGATDYLVKPFTARELLSRVAAHLETARTLRQAAAREAELRAEAEAARDHAIGVLESIQDGFFTLNRLWCFTYVNSTAEKLLVSGRDALLDRNLWELYPTVLGTVAEREYRRAVRDRVPVEFEFRYDEWSRWFAVKAYPTPEGGLSVYFHEITAQKEAENRLRAIYDGTYEYIWLLARDGTLLEANHAALAFAGVPRADSVGRSFWGTLWFSGTPGAPETVRQAIARAAAGEFVRFETSLRRPTGEWRDFDLSFHPGRNDLGEVVLIVPEGRDITERKHADERLRQQWHSFDTALSHIPDFVYTFDLEGRFTYVNRALLSLWQKPLEEALNKNFHELGYPADLAARLQRQIQQVIETRKPVRDYTPFTGVTGETREYEYIFVPVFTAGGAVEAVAGSTRDVTEHKRAEEQERERQAQLLDSARLESLGVLAGGIAHDFNNLLVGILGNASLLTEAVPESERSFAVDIVHAAERAAELTRQMLAYSGRGSFVIEVLDLNALIRQNLSLLRASLSRSVTFALDLGPEECCVEADRTQIHQVIMNLLINASEAVGDGPGRVAVRTRIVERPESVVSTHLHSVVPPGSYALLEIQDDGVGMGPETLKRIFDPFFTTKFTGRGLGLAALLGIVKGHHGEIEVESRPGLGSTFRVFLPLAARACGKPPEPESAPTPECADQTVLVVDDEPIVRTMAAAALQRGGFRVRLATNGTEALDVLRTDPGIALVILDLTMPVMTGEQALPLIKAIAPDIPILLSSGYNEAELARRFAAAGIAGVLQKPYTLAAIKSKVAEALRGKS